MSSTNTSRLSFPPVLFQDTRAFIPWQIKQLGSRRGQNWLQTDAFPVSWRGSECTLDLSYPQVPHYLLQSGSLGRTSWPEPCPRGEWSSPNFVLLILFLLGTFCDKEEEKNLLVSGTFDPLPQKHDASCSFCHSLALASGFSHSWKESQRMKSKMNLLIDRSFSSCLQGLVVIHLIIHHGLSAVEYLPSRDRICLFSYDPATQDGWSGAGPKKG